MENYKEISSDEIEIDLRGIFLELWRKAILIVLAGVIFAGAAFAGTKFVLTPMYTSTSMIYVLTKSTSMTSLADIQLSSQLTADYQLLATSRPVINEVIDNLKLGYSYEEMYEMVTIENPADTHVLQINIESTDPQEAKDIANEMADVVSERVANVMATDKPTIVERAVLSQKPSSPNTINNTMIGGFLGVILIIGVIVVLIIVDDTVKDEEDIVNYLNKEVLAVLPKEGNNKKISKNNNKNAASKRARHVRAERR